MIGQTSWPEIPASQDQLPVIRNSQLTSSVISFQGLSVSSYQERITSLMIAVFSDGVVYFQIHGTVKKSPSIVQSLISKANLKVVVVGRTIMEII